MTGDPVTTSILVQRLPTLPSIINVELDIICSWVSIVPADD